MNKKGMSGMTKAYAAPMAKGASKMAKPAGKMASMPMAGKKGASAMKKKGK